MAYLALYRKYRPKKFDEVVGQETVVRILKNALTSGKIGHAYIFSGTRGTGKTSIAKIFSKAINCINSSTGDVCQECEICKNIDNNCTDIIEIDAASNNGVDEIREIRNNVTLMPTVLKYKVYIIDEVHMLSTSAFNALLKTLEEPPKHAIFILATTELNKIPSTVLSRCQKLDFKKISMSKMENQLKYILENENINISDDVVKLISQLSDGSFRDAINLLDQVISFGTDNITVDDVYNLIGDISQSEIFDLLKNIVNGDIKGGLQIINKFYADGKNFYNISNRLQNIVTDIIINNNTHDYFSYEYENELMTFSKIDTDIIMDLYNEVFNLTNNIKKANNQKIFFETYYIKMALSFIKKEKMNNEQNVIETHESIAVDIIQNSSENTKKIIEEDNSSNKKIYINNALAEASKEFKKNFLDKYESVKDYISNAEYASVANLIIKAIPEVVSERTILFTFKNTFEVVLFDKNTELIKKLLKNIYKISYEVVAVSNEEWNNIKNKYIIDMKNGIKYKYIDEKEQKKNKKNISELEKEVENIFGDDIISME